MASVELALARLIADEDFVALDALYSRPNLFRAVGQTFTETWHSAFLGWLLDPRGSHGLDGFPLQRFLVTVAESPAVPSLEALAASSWLVDPSGLAAFAIEEDSSDVTVLPSERSPHEADLGSFGRADVWIEWRLASDDDDEADNRFVCIVEEKVKAGTHDGQGAQYPDHLADEADKNPANRGICVFLSPEMPADGQCAALTGDPRWYCIDFQALHDGVLVPVLRHRMLDREMRVLVEHYAHNLRVPVKGAAMAVTTRERELAQRIKEKHLATLQRLAALLADDVPELQPVVSPETRPEMVIPLAGGGTVSGASIRELFTSILDLAQDRGLLDRLRVPYGGGRTTWLINTEATHRDGESAFRGKPIVFEAGTRTLYVDAWQSRDRGLKLARKLLRDLGLPPSKEPAT